MDEQSSPALRPDALCEWLERARIRWSEDPQLAGASVWQIPKPAAGTSAVVFKAIVDRQEQALRFPTREDAARRDRYEALQEHFIAHDLVDCIATSNWTDDAIRINDRTWPVLRMQWVNGRTLNQYVEHLVEQRDIRSLGSLAHGWRDLVVRLQRAEFAHGDLQHGNVLVDDRGALRLVDFDCSWIVRFTGQPPPTETGHRNYQPASRPWGRWMDTFSGLVVYLSLLTLAKNPTPWHVLNTGENLLFQRDDFSPPFQTRVWKHVASIQDPELAELTVRLQECCVPGWTATGSLDALLVPRVRPWWERTRGGCGDRSGPCADAAPASGSAAASAAGGRSAPADRAGRAPRAAPRATDRSVVGRPRRRAATFPEPCGGPDRAHSARRIWLTDSRAARRLGTAASRLVTSSALTITSSSASAIAGGW